MALGQWHTCAAFESGGGNGSQGMEGDGKSANSNVGESGKIKVNITQICWGKNDFGQTDIGDLDKKFDLKVIAAGCNFTCVANTSKIACIGDNQFLSLDDNYSTNDSNHFFEIDDPDEAGSHTIHSINNNNINTNIPNNPNPPSDIHSTPKFGEQIASLTAGGLHACALGRKSLLKCWGSNSHGQADVSTLLKAIDGGFRVVTLGLQHSCGLSHDLILICWGSDQQKQWDVVRYWQNKNSVVTEVTSIGHMTCAKGKSQEVICNNQKKQYRMIDDVININLDAGDEEDRRRREYNLAFENSYVKISTGKLELPRLISISKDHMCFMVNEHIKIYELKCVLIYEENHDIIVIDKIREKMHIINEQSAQTNNEYLPDKISNELTKSAIQGISLGESNTCFIQIYSPGLYQGSAVKCIGKNRKKLNNIPPNIYAHLKTISTSYNHTCALSTKTDFMITKRTKSSQLDEHVYCWGDNSKGQTDVPRLSEEEGSSEGNGGDGAGNGKENGDGDEKEEEGVKRGVGSELMVFLRSGKDGDVGGVDKLDGDDNEGGQGPQSNKDPNYDSEPHATSSTDSDQPLPKYPVYYSAQVRTGLEFSCALTYDKNQPPIYIFGIKCWGNDSHHQLTPPKLDTLKMLELGSGHGCAIFSALNHLSCWGANTAGQSTPPSLGQHTETQFVKVRLGFQHSCGITYNSDVQCWGWSGKGGNLVLPRFTKGQGVAAGQGHTCTTTLKREIKCFGSNEQGQLEAPEGISLLVMHIEAGQQHTCANLTDGRAVCWGRADKGQLEVPDQPEGQFAGVVRDERGQGQGEDLSEGKGGDGNQKEEDVEVGESSLSMSNSYFENVSRLRRGGNRNRLL